MQSKIFETKEATAAALAEQVIQLIQKANNKEINIALSGGSTPFIMFAVWADRHKTTVDWSRVHFYWVDERCVAPDDAESNFGNTQKNLFDQIPIPSENIHRVLGEAHPATEAKRYSTEIEENLPLFGGIPVFDIILLGMGDDGHTASIFPPMLHLLEARETVVVGENPYSGQQRITLSGPVINKAEYIFFLVTGAGKASVLESIFKQKPGAEKYPASHITDRAVWYLDADAAHHVAGE